MKDFHVFFGVARAEALSVEAEAEARMINGAEGSSLIFISCNLLWLDSLTVGSVEGEGARAQQVV
jgi:hypothetical protein